MLYFKSCLCYRHSEVGEQVVTGHIFFGWKRQRFYHLPSHMWKSCSYRLYTGILFPDPCVYPGDANHRSCFSLLVKCQSHFLPTLYSLKVWTSGFAEPLSTCISLKFLLIMLCALPWTRTFYSRPVFNLHINSLPSLLKQMSHHSVPGLSDVLGTRIITAARPQHGMQCLCRTSGEEWDGTPTVSLTCCGHSADIPTQARQSNATLCISFISCGHKLLPFTL